MKTYINYINDLFNNNSKLNDDEEFEKLFLQLSHINEIEIRFDFIQNEWCKQLFYFYNDKQLFQHFDRKEFFFINNNIWLAFEKEFKNDYHFIKNSVSKMIDKYFKLKNINIIADTGGKSDEIEMLFKQ